MIEGEEFEERIATGEANSMLLSVQVRGLSEGDVAIRTELGGNVVLPTPEVRVYDRRLGARIGVALGGATTEKRRTVFGDGAGAPGNPEVKTVDK